MVKKSLLWVYRATLTLLWLIIIILACSVLTLRYAVLPHIEDYKEQITRQSSLVAGQKVTIGHIDAGWDGLNPHFSLIDVELYDSQNRPALLLKHIEASLSWLSIPLMEPRLSAISIEQPELTIRRETDGIIYVAGISMAGPARPEFPNWLLRQSQVDVLDAKVLWQDDLRKAPPLTLNKLNLHLTSTAWESLVGRHRFGLRATPSAGSSQPIDLRGDIYGKDVSLTNDWHGSIYGHLEGTDIAAWRNWLSYPIDLREGFGATRFWLDFADGKLINFTSDVILSNVKTRIAKNSPEAILNSLSGRLRWIQYGDGQEVRAEHFKVVTAGGLNMQNGIVGIRERLIDGKEWLQGDIQLDEMRLESLNALAAYLPLSETVLQQLKDMAPQGNLQKLDLRWKAERNSTGGINLPTEYSVRTRFSGLGVQAYQQVPGFSNLSGSLDSNQTGGTLTLNSQQALLDFKQTLRWPIPADKLAGLVNWRHSKKKTDITVTNLAISNPHLAGSINASYELNGIKGGHLELTGKFDHADGRFAHYYYPTILGKDTLHWLDTSILAARAEDISVVVKGDLAEFPFPNNKQGLFRVTAKLSDGLLDYSTGWPKIDGLKLNMLFEGQRMELNASAGSLLGNQITKCKAVIPVLDAAHPILDILAEGQGPVSEGIKFINNSPLLAITDGFTDDLETSGNGKLNLELHIPLDNTDASKVKGSYLITEGSMKSAAMPELTHLNGKLEFTESQLRAQNVSASLYGGPAQFGLISGKDHLIRIAARGRISDTGIKQALGPGITDHLTGSADWSSDISVQRQMLEIAIRSNLVGMASSLPAPLGKTAIEQMPLRIEKKQQTNQQDAISIGLANIVGIKLLRTQQNDGLQVDRGEIGLNVLPEIPSQRGVGIRGVLEHLDLDEWRSLLDSNTAGAGSGSFNLNKIDLAVNALDVYGRRINGLKLNAKAVSDGWQMNLDSREISGDAQWASQGKSKITARLKNLIAPGATPGNTATHKQTDIKQLTQAYPALDIQADNFELGQKKLGRLELLANEHDGDWSIEKLRLINADSVMTADGEWRNWKRKPNTRINLSWDISDLGRTLERYGYPDAVKGGVATISGQLKWPGSPHEFDIPGLGGNLQLDAQHGQILQIKPGVGRLFSVLSLQNLPRRLTFDFRDVFSKGFTFDKISASVKVDRGIMHSDDFKMEGPTARVDMKGETDLQKETQHLYVKVTPFISDSLSIAAFAGGPVAGAAAFIAQKILKDPINKLAEDNYEIIGTWDNPQEVKTDNNSATPSFLPLGK